MSRISLSDAESQAAKLAADRKSILDYYQTNGPGEGGQYSDAYNDLVALQQRNNSNYGGTWGLGGELLYPNIAPPQMFDGSPLVNNDPVFAQLNSDSQPTTDWQNSMPQALADFLSNNHQLGSSQQEPFVINPSLVQTDPRFGRYTPKSNFNDAAWLKYFNAKADASTGVSPEMLAILAATAIAGGYASGAFGGSGAAAGGTTTDGMLAAQNAGFSSADLAATGSAVPAASGGGFFVGQNGLLGNTGNSWFNNIANGAIKGGIQSGVQGQNPVQGALSGGVGGGLGSFNSSGGFFGNNGAIGNTGYDWLNSGANSAINGGIQAGVMGGNPLYGAASGGVNSVGNSLWSNLSNWASQPSSNNNSGENNMGWLDSFFNSSTPDANGTNPNATMDFTNSIQDPYSYDPNASTYGFGFGNLSGGYDPTLNGSASNGWGNIDTSGIGGWGGVGGSAGDGTNIDYTSLINYLANDNSSGSTGSTGTSGGSGGFSLSNILGGLLGGGSGQGGGNRTLGALLSSGLGAYGANSQANATTDLANKYMSMGAPYRQRLLNLYSNPSSFLSDPSVQVPVQQGTNMLAHSLSSQGNPIASGNALQQLQSYSTDQLYGKLAQEKQTLGNLGGLSSFNNAIPSLENNAIGQKSNIYNAVGAGINNIFQPQQSLADILRQAGY